MSSKEPEATGAGEGRGEIWGLRAALPTPEGQA